MLAIQAVKESQAKPGALPVAVAAPPDNARDAAAGALRRIIKDGRPHWVPVARAGRSARSAALARAEGQMHKAAVTVSVDVASVPATSAPLPEESTMPASPLQAPRCVARNAPPTATAVRRRMIDPTTCEREYGADEVEFMQALDRYKRTSGRMFPTCSEILEVVRSLGYVRSA